MTSLPVSQLTLHFEPSLPERWATLRAYLAYRVQTQNKSAKSIAADMDMSPSLLTRKLTAGTTPDDKDTQRFNTEDLEAYLESSGDVAAVIEYLAAKYMPGGDQARKARTMARMHALASEMERLIGALKDEA
jgi:hypothetical protein